MRYISSITTNTNTTVTSCTFISMFSQLLRLELRNPKMYESARQKNEIKNEIR